MPLIFSGREETENQQLGLFRDTKDYKDSDAAPKNYDSCSQNNKHSSSRTAKYENLNNLNSKSEDSSLDTIDQDFDKNSKHVYISEDLEEDSIVETTALRQSSEPSNSTLNTSILTDNYLTVSGTIKRGKKKGQSVEVVLNMSREELEILEANIANKRNCLCNAENGFAFHVFLWSIVCFPFSVIISGVYSFCMGTITWYNIFKLFSEEKPMGYRVIVPPLLIILYPFLIITVSLGLGLYAGFKQLSCCWNSWYKEFTDYEKGFFGWLCNSLDVPECSPYEVVVLSSVHKP